MIFKVMFAVVNAQGDDHECKVFAVDSGEQLERRIESTISNLKADGCRKVRVIDCFNISDPNPLQNR